jgi:hypothetical protein
LHDLRAVWEDGTSSVRGAREREREKRASPHPTTRYTPQDPVGRVACARTYKLCMRYCKVQACTLSPSYSACFPWPRRHATQPTHTRIPLDADIEYFLEAINSGICSPAPPPASDHITVLPPTWVNTVKPRVGLGTDIAYNHRLSLPLRAAAALFLTVTATTVDDTRNNFIVTRFTCQNPNSHRCPLWRQLLHLQSLQLHNRFDQLSFDQLSFDQLTSAN